MVRQRKDGLVKVFQMTIYELKLIYTEPLSNRNLSANALKFGPTPILGPCSSMSLPKVELTGQ